MAFNLEDYITVNERIIEFYKKFPDGSIEAEIIQLTEDSVIMKARAYRHPLDEHPGIGHAHEWRTKSNVSKTSMVENCETSAWGRSIAACGIAVSKAIATREEVESAKRKEEMLKRSEPQKIDPEKEKESKERLEVHKSIRDLHKSLGVSDDAPAKKALLLESEIAKTFTNLSVEQLKKYANFLMDKAEAADEELNMVRFPIDED